MSTLSLHDAVKLSARLRADQAAMEDLNAALALDPSNALAFRFRGGVNSAIGRYPVRWVQASARPNLE